MRFGKMRANQRQHSKYSGNTSSSSGSGANRITVGGVQLFPPFFQDVATIQRELNYVKDTTGKNTLKESGVVSTLIRMSPQTYHGNLHRVGTHRPGGVDDVLPKRFQSYPQYSKFVCHIDGKNPFTPVPYTEWSMNPDYWEWEEYDSLDDNGNPIVDEDGNPVTAHILSCKFGVMTEAIYLQHDGTYYTDEDGVDHPTMRILDDELKGYVTYTAFVRNFPTGEVDDDGYESRYTREWEIANAGQHVDMWLAETTAMMINTCPMCATAIADARAIKQRDERSVRQPTLVTAIPAVNLTWYVPVEQEVKGQKKTFKNFRFVPAVTRNTWELNGKVAARGFPTWVAIEGNATKGAPKETQDALIGYAAGLFRICKSCHVPGHPEESAHRITGRKATCTQCGEVHYYNVAGDSVPVDEEFFQAYPQLTGIIAVDEIECVHCGHLGVPDVSISCSSCDNPTPTDVSDVVTAVTIGGSHNLRFELHVDPKTGKRVYTSDDWDNMFCTSMVEGGPDPEAVGLSPNVSSSFSSLGNPIYSQEYVVLPPSDMALFTPCYFTDPNQK